MKKQFLALAIAATTAMSSQAELIKYETSDISASDLIQIYNLDLSKAEGATAWFETNELAGPREPQPPKLKRLVIDMAGGLDNLVINDFDSTEGNSNDYEAKTSGWIFRQLHVRATEVDTESMRINISVKPNNNLHTQVADFYIGGLQRTDRNPVVDIATVKANDKRLQLKLLERPQTFTDRYNNLIQHYALEVNWLGHGNKTIPLYVDIQRDNSPIAIELIEDGQSHLGQDYKVMVKFEGSQSDLKDAGHLSKMLQEFFKM
ncbi:hypothetical protein GCM10011297_13850 [Bacterioplanes sanyensis]|uniref:hypothetical protein n=1 Tax=Bacterioplanes sanyensis TaxID=1249553 RepID=UPI0016727C03|nr:hypothetical protein [Bacterioplanes sanyensis]GGY42045.1 hypothetical protein GCM10011297_13850 [Bacterioplanes sanyensis]